MEEARVDSQSGLLLGSALIGQCATVRERFHAEMLLDHAGRVGDSQMLASTDPTQLFAALGREAAVLATADAYLRLRRNRPIRISIQRSGNTGRPRLR